MGRAAGIGGIVGLALAVTLYFLLGGAMDDTAALARELRVSGETVHAVVVHREHREERRRTGGRTHTYDHYELSLTGALASGQPWAATLDVDPERFEATAEGNALDVVVLPAAPERYMDAASLAARDASGHEEGEGVMQLAMSGTMGGVAGFITALVILRRRAR